MILKWIQQGGQGLEARAAQQKDDEERKSRKDAHLIDVAHEALSTERAAQDRADLAGLVRQGLPNVQRERFKGKVRSKVWGVVSEKVGGEVSEMVDEITERIADAADADPFYKKLFDRP